MSVFKHTPGPWAVTCCLDYWVQAGDVGVALCGDLDWQGPDSNCVRDQREMEANARLIAAAPELLEALKAILAADPVTVHVGYDSSPGGGAYIYAEAVRLDDDAFIKARAAIAKATGGEA